MRRLRLDYDAPPDQSEADQLLLSGYKKTGRSTELPAYAPVIDAASGCDMAHLALCALACL
jgi:hypothetical protein